jgi:hypothetical protein
MLRVCVDCSHRYDFKADPECWEDPCLCPECGGDDTFGVPDVPVEREMAMLVGECA